MDETATPDPTVNTAATPTTAEPHSTSLSPSTTDATPTLDAPPAPLAPEVPPTAGLPPVAPAPAKPSILSRIPGYAVPLVLVVVPILFWIAAKLWPTQVYDGFVWRYYWGPIYADAHGYASACLLPSGTITATSLCTGGVLTNSGYNLVNTASWALLLGVCIVGIAQMLNRTKTPMDGRLIVAATLWVVAGSVFHVLEDTGLMTAPLQYFFITPTIYLLFGAGGVFSMVLGHYLRRVAERAGIAVALHKLWLILAVPVIGYLFLWLQPWDQVTHYVHPILVAVFAVVAYAVFVVHTTRLGRIDPTYFVGAMALGWIFLSIAYVVLFVQKPWHGQDPILFALWAPFLAAGLTALMYAIARAITKRKGPTEAAKRTGLWWALLQPMSLLILFAQMLDAFATSIGIDAGPYSEKHVLSAALIDLAKNTGDHYHIAFLSAHPTLLGFGTVKFVLSLLIISALNSSQSTESEREGPLMGLVKFAIIMVGIGPGIRDFTRMALGV